MPEDSSKFTSDAKNAKIMEMSDKDKKVFAFQLLNINIKHEIILSIILLCIITFLLVLDAIATEGWSRETHIYSYFSYMHVILIIIPIIFLILVYFKRRFLESNLSFCNVLHLVTIFLVLNICAFISVRNNMMNVYPYPYIISMFCIGSALVLGKNERYIVYITSYLLYSIGCVTIIADIYQLIGNIFFFTILVIMALIISQIHYSSYKKDFMNQKMILDKNKELDRLYRASEEALKQRTVQLNETVEYEKLRTTFFTNISHELRTPLSLISSAEQMIRMVIAKENNAGKTKALKQYMKIIRQNCYRLTRLVANLIDITKIDAGYFNINLKDYDIVKIAEDITQSIAKFVEDKGLNLIFNTDVREYVITCDADKIERIMLNLLSNAVKFTPKGGTIYVNITETDASLNLHVKDTGIGIPENMRQSIFERFVQVDNTISRNNEGSGIGLSIVKSLVDMHGGDIVLISEEGKGSEFIIELPKRITLTEKTEQASISEKKIDEKINIEFSDIYK